MLYYWGVFLSSHRGCVTLAGLSLTAFSCFCRSDRGRIGLAPHLVDPADRGWSDSKVPRRCKAWECSAHGIMAVQAPTTLVG